MLCAADEEGVGWALAASVSGFFSSVAMALRPTGRRGRPGGGAGLQTEDSRWVSADQDLQQGAPTHRQTRTKS